MSEHAKQKALRLNTIIGEIAVITTDMESDVKNDTPDNREKLTVLLSEGETLRKSIEQDNAILGLKTFSTVPVSQSPAGGDGEFSEPFQGVKSLGDQFIESGDYKNAVAGGGMRAGGGFAVEAKGFRSPYEQKATFTSTGTGANSTVNYLPGILDIRQQPLSIRNLLSVGQTTQAAVTYLRETSFTNAANTVAEEGLKPEATFVTEAVVAAVKKIAVIGRVTDEMFADFPMMRDYVNERLRFMVLAKEEQQLYAGTGVGSQILGITLTPGIQTQPVGVISATNTVADNIHRAITKIRTLGFAEPDGIALHPTDWQILRLAKDTANQYYGGGPFSEQYGNGPYKLNPSLWGLTPVVTTAATAGTALVGAFRESAQIWQREGITVATTDTDQNDFQYNRVAIRVEERLALAVYRPLGFCTVTGIL